MRVWICNTIIQTCKSTKNVDPVVYEMNKSTGGLWFENMYNSSIDSKSGH